MDDAPGREVGRVVGVHAFNFAETIVFPDWAMEFGGAGFLPSTDCMGDFDGDSHVGSSDFILFLTAYGEGWTGAYDINNNEEIGTSDLLLMLQVYGSDCN